LVGENIQQDIFILKTGKLELVTKEKVSVTKHSKLLPVQIKVFACGLKREVIVNGLYVLNLEEIDSKLLEEYWKTLNIEIQKIVEKVTEENLPKAYLGKTWM
jgi:predicted HTH domain antitoxin